MYVSIASVQDPPTGLVFSSQHTLDPDDCQNVGRAAGEVWRLDRMVDWFEAAVERGKKIGLPTHAVRRLAKDLEEAREHHDDILIEKGLGATTTELTPDGQPGNHYNFAVLIKPVKTE